MTALATSSFIGSTTHDIVYLSPTLTSPDEALMIGFAEVHNDHPLRHEVRDLNAALIDQLVTEKSLMLFEGVRMPSDHKPITGNVRASLIQKMHLSNSAQNNFLIYGWDAINHVRDEIEESLGLCPRRKLSHSDGCEDLSHLCNHSKEHKATSSPNEHTVHALLNIADDPFLRTMYDPSELRQEICSGIFEGFPERAEALSTSLEIALKIREKCQLTGKIFFIGGIAHFIEPVPLPDKRVSLKHFYEKIANLPIAIYCAKKLKK